jgi:hypothetical protein
VEPADPDADDTRLAPPGYHLYRPSGTDPTRRVEGSAEDDR